MLLMASARNRVTRSFAWDRASESFDRYVTATIVKNTGTVSSTNRIRMVGRNRSFLVKRPFIGGPSRPWMSGRERRPPPGPAEGERQRPDYKVGAMLQGPARIPPVAIDQQ